MSLPAWGVPWHGRIQGDLLHLPNGTTRDWPQPDGVAGGLYPDHAGYTFLQRLPGAPEIVRTTEEQAADEAAGMEWRDSFIVGGTDTLYAPAALDWPQIHSASVGGWIYAAPGGGRWLIKACGIYEFDQGGPLNIPVRLVRFGDFGGTPATISLTISATAEDMGQMAPSVSSVVLKAKVEDITPAGDKAIIMLYLGSKTPIGFLLLTLTGTPGVDFVSALTTIKTRAQTLGAQTSSVGATAVKMLAYHDFVTTINNQRGAHPNCGYVETINTPSAVLRTPLPGESSNVTVGSGEDRIAITGRILAMWFDPAGTPQPLALDSTQVYTLSAPEPANSVSGRVVGRVNWSAAGGSCVEGANSYTEYMSFSMSQTASESLVQSATLSYAGQSVAVEHRHERTVAHAVSYTGTSKVQVTAPIASSGTRTGGRTITVDGSVTMTISEDESGVSHQLAGPFVDYPPAMLAPIDNIPRMTTFTLSASNPDTWVPAARRWANNLIGWRTSIGAGISVGTALTPLGPMPPDVQISTAPFGSLNPLTGEAVFPSATPVSWT